MKLIGCHIENFGTLSNYDCEFNPKLTVIKEDNGFGKTTLADFIRAMFYGFPNASTPTYSKKSRGKYAPWQGGKYGGTLEFEYGKKEYRIERYFGTSKPKEDTFKIYELNPFSESNRFTNNIGVELFGIDSESFARSTYMRQVRDISAPGTGNIYSQLQAMVEGTDDINNFEKAVELLNVCRKNIEPDKGSSFDGHTAALPECSEKIRNLEQKLALGGANKEELQHKKEEKINLENELKAKGKELENARKEIIKSSEMEAVKSKKEIYGNKVNDMNETKERLDAVENKYSGAVPSETEIENIERITDEITACKSGKIYTESEISSLKVLKKINSRMPSEDELSQCSSNCKEYERCLTNAQNAMDRFEEAEKEYKPLSKFASISDGEIEKNKERLKKFEVLHGENEKLASGTDSEARNRKMASKGGAFLQVTLVVGIVALIAGIVLFGLSEVAFGAMAIVIGVVAMVIWVYMRIKRMMPANGGEREVPKNIQQQIEKNIAEISNLESLINSFTCKYTERKSPAEQIAEISINYESYKKCKKRVDDCLSNLEKQKVEMSEFENKISTFLLQYFDDVKPEDFAKDIVLLQQYVVSYNNTVKYNKLYSEFKKITDGYNIKEEPGRKLVNELQFDAANYKEISRQYDILKKQAGDFYSENRENIEQGLPGEQPDIQALKSTEKILSEEINEINSKIIDKENEISLLQRDVDNIPQTEDELERQRERYNGLEHNRDLLCITADKLKEARKALNNRYLRPVEECFENYMNRILGSHGKVYIDKDLNIGIECAGEARNVQDDEFSAGQADSIMLCMRFALVDSLFPNEKPFIILDDPFVNLDDKRLKTVLNTVRELSNNYQIIYLVCNMGRSL